MANINRFIQTQILILHLLDESGVPKGTPEYYELYELLKKYYESFKDSEFLKISLNNIN